MRCIVFLCLLAGSAPRVSAQPMTLALANQLRLTLNDRRPTIQQVHTRLRLGTFYLHKTLDVKLSLDSALAMATQAEAFSHRLAYTGGGEEAVFLRGCIYIQQRRIVLVERLLSSVSDTNRIRLLLAMGKDWLRPTMRKDMNLPRARGYFGRAQAASQHIHHRRWQQESQFLMGISYLLVRNWPASEACIRPVILAHRQAGDLTGECWTLLRWTALAVELGNPAAEPVVQRALALARRLNDKPKQASLLMLLGIHHTMQGKLALAEQAAHQAQAIYKVVGKRPCYQHYLRLAAENDFIHRSYIPIATPSDVIAYIQWERNNLDQVLRTYLNAVDEAERSGLTDNLDDLYFMIGNVYLELQQYDKCVAYYQQSLSQSRQKGEVTINVSMIRKLVTALLKQGKTTVALALLNQVVAHEPPIFDNKVSLVRSFGECYLALKQYRKAESAYQQALQWAKAFPSLDNIPFYTSQLGQFYVTTGQFAKAARYLHGSKPSQLNLFPVTEQLEWIWMQFKVDSAAGHYASALRHFQHHRALSDSVFNQTKSQQLAHLETRYETHKKEQELRLRAKNIALLTQQSQSQRSQRNTLLASTVLLVALLGAGYNRYRLNQRNNQLLQAQQALINQKNKDLQRLLADKERLLKEIHHRVKNNLQVVMSLLNSQAATLQDQAALSAIQESQHRVQAIALIHQKLYQAEGVARIQMASYVDELVAYLHDSFDLVQPVRFELEVAPIELDVTLAVPLGLIINEAITNALKYAFPAGHSGRVSVFLHGLAPGSYELTIADTGVGLPPGYDTQQSRSLGMTLMYGFSEQLGGELRMDHESGLRINLSFSEEPIGPAFPPVPYA